MITLSDAVSGKSNTGGPAAQLCAYTCDVLSQMAGIVQNYLDHLSPEHATGRTSEFREHMGSHLRHIIEHYETLVNALATSGSQAGKAIMVDYDARERNAEIENNPQVALAHIGQLRCFLGNAAQVEDHMLDLALDVHTRGGLAGEHNFCTRSTLARELMFLNSHATHHFAILQGYAHQRGTSLGIGFGKAPATVAHEQRMREVAAA